MALIHTFIRTFTHKGQVASLQSANLLIRNSHTHRPRLHARDTPLTELNLVMVRPGTDLFTWTMNGNTLVICLWWPPLTPAIQSKYAYMFCPTSFHWRCSLFHALCVPCFKLFWNTECFCKQLNYFKSYVLKDKSNRMKTPDVNHRVHARQ